MSEDVSVQGDLDWLVSHLCESGQCVAVARRGESVLIRNTSNPNGPVSEFTTEEWRQFLAGAKLGDFDGIA
jgi:predicted secreted Zn-dependent protease